MIELMGFHSKMVGSFYIFSIFGIIDYWTDSWRDYFEETFLRSITVNIDDIEVHIPSLDDLIHNKKATGRIKDLADAEALEARQGTE